MLEGESRYKLFSGSSHPVLASQMAQFLEIPLGKVTLETFPDEEIFVQILENVRGRDVFVVQSIAVKPNFYLMELLIMIDALKRASARSIVAVIPYFGYCRQDRKDQSRVPITAKLVTNLLEEAGATRVLTMDLHTSQVQGFFDIPVDNLYARVELVPAIQDRVQGNLVVVSPDLGSIKLARVFAADLGAGFAIVDKMRVNARQVLPAALIGEVEGSDVLLVDDMCSTGGTLMMAAEVCQAAGAKRIFAVVTHGLLLGEAVRKLEESPIEKLWISNTVPGSDGVVHPKIETVSIASLLGKVVDRIMSDESISSLFTTGEVEKV